MWFLNKAVSNVYTLSRRYGDRKKRSVTYEFGSSGVGGNLSMRSATHPLKLALLFLLFDIEVSFLMILITNFIGSLVPLQMISVWYIFFLFIGV